MLILPISRYEFNKYEVGRIGSTFSAKEIGWYKMSNGKGLGILLEDNYDKDFSYITFEHVDDLTYSIDRIDVDHEDFLEGESALHKRMIELYTKEKLPENLYSDEVVEGVDISAVINIDEEVKKYLSKNPEQLYNLSPRKFEELIAAILVDLGFNVELTKQTRDGGKDIIASISNSLTRFIMYVECKRFREDNKVDVSIVREVIGVQAIDMPNKSLIITTSYFTADATNLAKSYEHQVELQDFNNLKGYLDAYK